jgi:hypothetical protein
MQREGEGGRVGGREGGRAGSGSRLRVQSVGLKVEGWVSRD